MTPIQLENSPIIYYVSRCESDEWVLLLHAAFVDYRMFLPQIAYFKEKYNIIAVDMIGHGQSTVTKKGDDVNKTAFWIQQILQKEKIDAIHLLGVSLGAVLAQDFANHHPEMVKSLACFGGYDINNFDENMQRDNSLAQMIMMLKALVSIKWFAKANKKVSAYTAQAQDEFYGMNLQFPKKSFMYLAGLNSMVNKCRPQKRGCPLLIGCGKQDIPMQLAAIEMWQATEPGCQMVVFEGAGHCVNMDVPHEFNAEIEKFWKGCAG